MNLILVDSHLDIAYNAVEWDRDLRLSAHETRKLEAGMSAKGRATGTVGFPDMRRGNIAIAFATVFSRVSWPWSGVSGHRTGENGVGHARGQLAYYHQIARSGGVRLIGDRPTLEKHLVEWSEPVVGEPPLGLVIAMEGADPILSPDDLTAWWDDGLRVLGLAHYGVSLYSHGTGAPGGLLPAALPLLAEMERLGIALDVSHLAERAFYESLDSFGGRVLASHSNCRALVDGDRQLTDDMVRRLVEADGVIGAVMDAWMLQVGWQRGVSTSQTLTLKAYAHQIDHVCQVAGDSRHAGIGSDLDGGYGTEQCPSDLDTIADLQKVADLLSARGYSEADIALIMNGNWIRLLRETLPA
jgi:membrane dipeptidase